MVLTRLRKAVHGLPNIVLGTPRRLDAISEVFSSQDYDQNNHTAIIYDLSGKRLDALRPGLNVIRLDGKTRIIAQ